MVNSIRTTSNTQTTTSAPTTPLFSVGTVVLCPSIDHDSPQTFLEAQVAFAKSKHATRKPNQSPARGTK